MSGPVSDQRWEEHPMQDGELCSFCGPGTFVKFQHKLILNIAAQDSSSSLHPSNSRGNEEAQGNWRKGAAGNRLQDLPDWLDLTENLEDAEMPAPANISHDPDSESPMKVVPRKHRIYTHFPKDRNCEVCKPINITRAPCRRGTGEAVPRAEKFGDLITADHKSPQRGR